MTCTMYYLTRGEPFRSNLSVTSDGVKGVIPNVKCSWQVAARPIWDCALSLRVPVSAFKSVNRMNTVVQMRDVVVTGVDKCAPP